MDIEKLHNTITNVFSLNNERVDFQEIDIKLQPLCGL